MNNKSKSLFESNWFILSLIIPIFQPDFFKEFLITDNIYLIAKVIALIIVSIKYFTVKTERFGILILIFFGILYLSTYINNQSVFFALKKTVESVLICMIIDLGIYYKKDKFIELLYRFISILVIINFIGLIVFPNGLISSYMNSMNYKAHFLSIKNGMIPWMILCGSTGILDYYLNPSKAKLIKLNILFIIITISMIIVKSTTGLIGWLIFLFFTKIINKSIFKIFINVKNISIIGTILFIMIVIFRVNEYFDELFYLLFQKDASFTGRVDLWDQAMRFIKEKPIFGYGLREIGIIMTNYGRNYTAHNFILEVTMSGGFMSISYFYCLLIKIYLKSRKFKWHVTVKHLSTSLLIFFITTLTEAAIYRYQWFSIFALMYNLPSILNNKLNENLHVKKQF